MLMMPDVSGLKLNLRSFGASALALILLLSSACNNDEQTSAYEKKLQRDKQAIQNQCISDADCHVSGCHQTLCRATIEADFCEHRFVVRLDNENDLAAIMAYVRALLTDREAETLQSGGYATNLWTLSFHASLSQRQRVASALRALSYSGLAILDKDALRASHSLAQQLSAVDRDISLKRMQGAGPLVEKIIRSGDVLSRNDISKTWENLSPLLPDTGALDYSWDYDVVLDTISSIRLWPVYKNERIAVFDWSQFSFNVEDEDLRLSATVAKKDVDTLKKWSQNQAIILLSLGREILVAARVKEPIQGDSFEMLIHGGAKKRELSSQLKTLQRLYEMQGGVHFDEDATSRVERDLDCAKKVDRSCACIVGNCQWRVSPEFNECMVSPEK